MTTNRKPNETNAQEVRKQNQQSMQKKAQYGQTMGEEFGSETDVEEVKKQNQQSEQNKSKAAKQQTNQFKGGFR
ncbi:MAG TPA: gamma-type small acid-soluble spore protein [Sporosarcina sp.]|nr:gamma-type small acid-soluble spore protein [Sporosarcina sp.]